MAENPLSKELVQFINSSIQSVEQLEILCLLAENPSRSWLRNDVFRSIQSSEKSVLEGLQYFAKCNLLRVDAQGLFQFYPKTAELNHAATELVKVYRERPVAVIETIYRIQARPVSNSTEEITRSGKDK